MRHISKGAEPQIISDFKAIQHSAGLPATYDAFGGKGNKAALNDILRAEQQNICCYCQQRIDHYLGEPETGAHNEHLYPQSKDPGDGSVDLDYTNIFACCIRSQGLKKKSQYCGESKGKQVICGSITDPHCEGRFKYNLIGEILPAGEYDIWEDYVSNYSRLGNEMQELVDEIRILNLNCNYLIEERKKVIDGVISWVQVASRQEIISWLDSVENQPSLPIFYNTIKYFLGQLVKKL